jgi:hypothetical protein
MELRLDDLTHDTDYEVTQSIGAAAFGEGFEGVLVPSATRLGDNLVLFPERLGAESTITVISSRDPRLYVEHQTDS